MPRRSRASATEFDEHVELALAEIPCDSPLHQLLGKESWTEIVACVQQLSRAYREAFIDHFESGLSVGELAAERGVSVEGLRKRTARAIRRVAECLERRGIEPLPPISISYCVFPARLPAPTFQSDREIIALAGE